jgi:hypothetical protein
MPLNESGRPRTSFQAEANSIWLCLGRATRLPTVHFLASRTPQRNLQVGIKCGGRWRSCRCGRSAPARRPCRPAPQPKYRPDHALHHCGLHPSEARVTCIPPFRLDDDDVALLDHGLAQSLMETLARKKARHWRRAKYWEENAARVAAIASLGHLDPAGCGYSHTAPRQPAVSEAARSCGVHIGLDFLRLQRLHRTRREGPEDHSSLRSR